MLRVWLDHAKWIDLARAAHGQPGGSDYEVALLVARAAVELGQVSFVLDGTRYMELYRRAEPESRRRLAVVMSELSRMHTMASPRSIVLSEFHRAFHVLFGVPFDEPPFTQLFGVGAGFAFGQEQFAYRIPEAQRAALVANSPGVASTFEASATTAMEQMLLMGPTDDLSREWREQIEAQSFGVRYAEGERELAARIEQHGVRKKKMFDDIMSVTELVDVMKPMNEVAAQVGLNVDAVLDAGRTALEALLEELPSRVTARALRRARMRNPDNIWKPNDLEDIAALSFTIPYCDVVLTEKSWVQHATLAGLPSRFGTALLHDVAKLPDVLAELSVSA